MVEVENFISIWNEEFPDYVLTALDLKKPRAVMGALFRIFDSLGIDRDAILKPPTEECRTENMMYYWDLLPVINMTRVLNHLMSVMHQVGLTISITHFLQPTMRNSRFMLVMLLNLMVFNKERLRIIAPYEEELFAKTNEVKALADKKNHLLNMLNQQAEEKGKRAERVEKLNLDIKIFEQELEQENEGYEEDKQKLKVAENENLQMQTILEQKKIQLDAQLEEIEKKKALRVYDAEDIKTLAEQAARKVQEAEEELESLKETLMQKETSLKNLQTIKPYLDTANNLLNEIEKNNQSLREYQTGDYDEDSKEGELEVSEAKLCELEAQLAELKAAREEERKKIRENREKRQQVEALLASKLRESEEDDKKCSEQSAKALQQIEEIKESIHKYKQEKAEGLEEINEMRIFFTNELKSMEDILLKKANESEKRIKDRVKNRNLM